MDVDRRLLTLAIRVAFAALPRALTDLARVVLADLVAREAVLRAHLWDRDFNLVVARQAALIGGVAEAFDLTEVTAGARDPTVEIRVDVVANFFRRLTPIGALPIFVGVTARAAA
jgi:hypothetical protein